MSPDSGQVTTQFRLDNLIQVGIQTGCSAEPKIKISSTLASVKKGWASEPAIADII